MKKLPGIGIGTITGIFGGITLGAILWLLGTVATSIIGAGLPRTTGLAFFLIGIASGIGTGIAWDWEESK